MVVLHFRVSYTWRHTHNLSYLHYKTKFKTQELAVVKLLGSFRPNGLLWPLHQNSVFTGLKLGTVGTSLRRSQSHQLNGKALRLLKKVTVTSAVYRSLDPLNRVFRYQHWAGVANHTHPFGLAVSYVFDKQSPPLGF